MEASEEGSVKPTEDDYQLAETYFRKLADTMGLRDWVVEVSRETPSDDESEATSSFNDTIRYVKVRLSSDWWEADSERKRQTATHELLHAVQRPLMDVLEAFADDYGVVGKQFVKQAERAEEALVDGLAVAVAPRMPAWPGDT